MEGIRLCAEKGNVNLVKCMLEHNVIQYTSSVASALGVAMEGNLNEMQDYLIRYSKQYYLGKKHPVCSPACIRYALMYNKQNAISELLTENDKCILEIDKLSIP